MSRRPPPVGLLGEPIVVTFAKYRIREVLRSASPEQPAVVRARMHFGWREVVAEVLEYDPVACVFRGHEVSA